MAKRRKIQQQQKQKSNPFPHNHSKAKGPPQPNTKSGKSQTRKETQGNAHPRDLEPTIPFSPEDAILLVGEGDLSFSRALVEHHCCEDVTATVLEPSLEELTAKYPHVHENVDLVEAGGGKIFYGVDAKKMGPWARKSGKESTGIFDRICTREPSSHLSPTYCHDSSSSSSSSPLC